MHTALRAVVAAPPSLVVVVAVLDVPVRTAPSLPLVVAVDAEELSLGVGDVHGPGDHVLPVRQPQRVGVTGAPCELDGAGDGGGAGQRRLRRDGVLDRGESVEVDGVEVEPADHRLVIRGPNGHALAVNPDVAVRLGRRRRRRHPRRARRGKGGEDDSGARTGAEAS
ncbi:hypothetical protein J7E95_32870 [Streptomyces sp. ISL-14]|nr:hypothetical protein [Streptomyces sp. ISL-14]